MMEFSDSCFYIGAFFVCQAIIGVVLFMVHIREERKKNRTPRFGRSQNV